MEVIFLKKFFANDCQDICFGPEKNLNLFSADSKKIIRFHYRLHGLSHTSGTIQILRKHVFGLFYPTHPPCKQM